MHLPLVFLICYLPLILVGQTPECVLKKEKDNIKVYTCKSDTSKFRSLKAEFVISNTSIPKLKAFLFNAPNFVNWQYNTIESSALEIISDNEMIYRVVVDAPWPVANREIIVKISADIRSDDFAYFNVVTAPSQLPEIGDLVRVPFFRARWTVRRLGQSLHAVYNLDIDPGGYVPPFLVNMATADGPYESFRNLKILLEQKE